MHYTRSGQLPSGVPTLGGKDDAVQTTPTRSIPSPLHVEDSLIRKLVSSSQVFLEPQVTGDVTQIGRSVL